MAVRTALAASLFAACATDASSQDEDKVEAGLRSSVRRPWLERAGTTPSTPTTVAKQVATGHPLDPLTADEISTAIAAVQAKGYNGPTTYMPIVRLAEPPKSEVLSWSPGQTYSRKAFVVVFEDVAPSGRTHELVVSLEKPKAKVISDTLKPGVQPPVLNAEYGVAMTAPFSDPRFVQALAARGYGPESWMNLFCAPLSAGNFHIPGEEGRRLFRVTCLDASFSNPWSHPVEGLTAVVDLVTGEVINVIDSGVVPPSSSDGDFINIAQAPAAKPLVVSAPNGDDYTVDGHVLTSPRWQFHFKVEGRDGLMISGVKFNDHGTLRSVLYRANLSETFVPYADPTSNFYYRTYMDEGEYGFGKSTQPLVPNKDCPENATFYDATITDDYGAPFVIPNAVCVFEEKDYLGYHHTDIIAGQSVARAPRNIVVRYATIVGNYDYFFDWTFKDDGSIGFRVGAGGAVETRGQAAHTVQQATGDALKWGTLVDDRIGAPNHQHIFNVRLDMDVDGTSNSLVTLTPTVVPAHEPNSYRTSGWTAVPTKSVTEGALDSEGHAQITVFNEHRTNSVGNAVGYALESHNETSLLMSNDDPAALRASFAKSPVWVTPYDAKQVYAAGDYVFMADGTTDGIQNWTQAGRSVNDKDLVLWVNVGFSHITHSENWPMMATEWFGEFHLTPFNFFSKGPIVDVNDAQ